MSVIVVEREVGGRTLRIETGRIAKQSAGSVYVTYGGCAVLVTYTEIVMCLEEAVVTRLCIRLTCRK